MSSVSDLLDKAKEASGAASDAELSRSLGVTRASVSNWRSGRNYPDTVQCATLAGLTGVPLARVLGIVGEARAISREEKSVWRKLAASAAVLALMVGALPLPARSTDAPQASQPIDSISIMRSVEWVRTTLALILLWLKWRLSRRKPAPDNVEAFSAC